MFLRNIVSFEWAQMNNMKRIKGKIVLVDDEKYEKTLLEMALLQKQWKIELVYFKNPMEAFEFLKKTDDEIFLIIADMNMPGMNGLDLKKAIDMEKALFQKSIPFIFFSNSASKEQITQAYDYRVQGYFTKPLTVEEQANQLDIIIKYWIISRHPNKDYSV